MASTTLTLICNADTAAAIAGLRAIETQIAEAASRAAAGTNLPAVNVPPISPPDTTAAEAALRRIPEALPVMPDIPAPKIETPVVPEMPDMPEIPAPEIGEPEPPVMPDMPEAPAIQAPKIETPVVPSIAPIIIPAVVVPVVPVMPDIPAPEIEEPAPPELPEMPDMPEIPAPEIGEPDTDQVDGALERVREKAADVADTPAQVPVPRPNTAPANQALNEVQKNARRRTKWGGITGISAVRRALNAVNDQLKKIAATAAKGVKWGIVGITAGATAAAVSIVKLGANLEQTRMAFQTMTRDAEKGNAILAKLNEFAEVTPFSNEEIIQAGKSLLAYGVPVQNVMGLVKTLGDVSAGSGKKIAELAPIFGKVFAKGRMDTEAMNMMVDAGIPIIDVLAKQYGKTGAEIYKMAEAGEITAADVNKAFTTMTSAGGVYADMMKKQSQSVGGLWSTALGGISNAFATLGEQLMPVFAAVLEWVNKWISKFGELVADGTVIRWLANIAATAITVGATGLQWLNTIYEYGKATFTTLQKVCSIAFEALQYGGAMAFIKIVEGFNTVYEYGKAAFTTLQRVYLVCCESMQALFAAAFVFLVNTAVSSINAVIQLLNKIPGVDIDLVGKPKFLDAVEQYAELSAQKAAEELGAIASGEDFKQAGKNVERKNKALDPVRQYAELSKNEMKENFSSVASGEDFKKAASKIKAENEQIQKSADAMSKKVREFGENAAAKSKKENRSADLGREQAIKGESKGQKEQNRKIDTDSLTKIGLYGNYGRSNVKSLDQERNRTLAAILEKMNGITPGEALT